MFVNNGNVSMEGCLFIDNTVKFRGTILIEGKYNVSINNTVFKNNAATRGAGIVVRDNQVKDSVLEISNSVFENARGYIEGAVSFYGEKLLIDRCTFRGNFMGVSIHHSSNALERPTVSVVKNSIFENNADSGSTGSAIVNTAARVEMEISNSTFINNTAGRGGAIYFHARYGSLGIKNCSFEGNSATIMGGAIDTFAATINSSTFIKNSAEIGGSIFSLGHVNINQCVFGEDDTIRANGTLTLISSNLTGSDPVSGYNQNIIEGLDVKSFQINAGEWNFINTHTEVSKLQIKGGLLNIHNDAVLNIRDTLELSKVVAIHGPPFKDDTVSVLSGDGVKPKVIIHEDSVTSAVLGDTLLENIDLINRGTFVLKAETHTTLKLRNTTLCTEGVDSVFIVNSNAVLDGDIGSKIIVNNSTFIAHDSVEVRVPIELHDDSTFTLTLTTSTIKWTVSPQFAGTLKVVIPVTIEKPKIGDVYNLMFWNGTEHIGEFSKLDMKISGKLIYTENGLKLEIIDKVRQPHLQGSFGDITVIIMLSLFIIGLSTTILVSSILACHWSKSEVIHKSNKPSLPLILVGIFLSYIGSFLWAVPVSDVVCELRVWLPFMGFIAFIFPVLAKTYRIKQVFTLRSLTDTIVSLMDLVKITLGAIVIQLIILILWSASSPNRVEYFPDKENDDFTIPRCSSRIGYIFLLIVGLYDGAILIIGAYFAYVIYRLKMARAYNESTWLSCALYNSLVWGVLLVVFGVVFSIAGALDIFSTVLGVIIWINTSVTLGVLFAPLARDIFAEAKQKKDDTSVHVTRMNTPPKNAIASAGSSLQGTGIHTNASTSKVAKLQRQIAILQEENEMLRDALNKLSKNNSNQKDAKEDKGDKGDKEDSEDVENVEEVLSKTEQNLSSMIATQSRN
mmetsp:Transcript_10722/g.11783  ORF Transcript_10722/g.11783 Transcript_10722/m.11783 type:complete len:904 (+) Transcript_10722:3-2714(+)